ncbi:MAG: hypothetical protein OXS30_13330 [Chloroflexota bacterium]|nr:hypothetical protein [Chloroflexota bacterium]
MPEADRRRRWSNALVLVGVAAALVGFLAAFSVIGFVILVLVPLAISGAAVLVPSRGRVVAALLLWAYWFFSLWDLLT